MSVLSAAHHPAQDTREGVWLATVVHAADERPSPSSALCSRTAPASANGGRATGLPLALTTCPWKVWGGRSTLPLPPLIRHNRPHCGRQ